MKYWDGEKKEEEKKVFIWDEEHIFTSEPPCSIESMSQILLPRLLADLENTIVYLTKVLAQTLLRPKKIRTFPLINKKITIIFTKCQEISF